jgi:hypothetical protein
MNVDPFLGNFRYSAGKGESVYSDSVTDRVGVRRQALSHILLQMRGRICTRNTRL